MQNSSSGGLSLVLVCAKIYSPFGGSESTGIVNHMEKPVLYQSPRIRTRSGANKAISGAFSSQMSSAAQGVQVSLHRIMFANQ